MTGFHDLEALVASGQKINAIKEFRARTGVGLKDAKDAVEWFEAHRQWPAGYERDALVAAAVDPIPQPHQGHPLHAVEQLVVQGQIIPAIKELRSLTLWGLRETKDAVEEYRDRGAWPGSVLATLGQPQTPSEPSRAAANAPSSSEPSAMLQALAHQLGYAPHVHLAARARRGGLDGQLVMLRERSCFVRQERGQWVVELAIAYDTVHHVEVDRAARAVLYISVGHAHERFELDAADAEAALALFRVFAP